MNKPIRLLTTIALAIVCQGLPAAEFYVATAGDDAHPGTQDRPFATLERARDAVRALRVTEPQAAVRVVLGGGTYRLGQAIVFDLRDIRGS